MAMQTCPIPWTLPGRDLCLQIALFLPLLSGMRSGIDRSLLLDSSCMQLCDLPLICRDCLLQLRSRSCLRILHSRRCLQSVSQSVSQSVNKHKLANWANSFSKRSAAVWNSSQHTHTEFLTEREHLIPLVRIQSQHVLKIHRQAHRLAGSLRIVPGCACRLQLSLFSIRHLKQKFYTIEPTFANMHRRGDQGSSLNHGMHADS